MRHDRMVTLVEHMRQLHQQQAAARREASDRELYQRQTARPVFAERGVEATDGEIDKLVASRELYGLMEEEIRVVEGNR